MWLWTLCVCLFLHGAITASILNTLRFYQYDLYLMCES